MTYEVIPYEAQPLAERWNYAGMLSQAGDLIPKGLQVPIRNESNAVVGYEPSPGKVMLVLEVGASLGLHPTAALGNVYVIEGRVSMSAQLMVAVIRRAGHTIRVVTSGDWADGSFLAEATLTRTDDPDHTYRVIWSKDRAERAGLLSKDNWQHYPEALCVARSTSEVARQGGSDVLLGIGYTPEELGATVDVTGRLLTLEELEQSPATAEDEPAKPTPTARARKAPTKGRQGTKRKTDAEPEPAPESAPEGAVGGDVEATEPMHPADVTTAAGEVSVEIQAGVPIADGPMAGLVPTEAQVAAAEQMRALQEQGTDTTVAEAIMQTEIPAEPVGPQGDDEREPDEPEVDQATGEVTETADDFAESAWRYSMSVNEGEDVPRGADLVAFLIENGRTREDMMALWKRAESAGILSTDLRMGLINAGGAVASRQAQLAAGDDDSNRPAALI